jgi:hypothetical protein
MDRHSNPSFKMQHRAMKGQRNITSDVYNSFNASASYHVYRLVIKPKTDYLSSATYANPSCVPKKKKKKKKLK